MEVFKDISNYNGLYKISNLGNILSLSRECIYKDGRRKFIKESMMKQNINDNGYNVVKLSKNGIKKTFKTHQLVAIAFLGHTKFNGLVVDHIDNDKLNNNISNLQLITQRENSSKDKKNKSSKFTGVSWHKQKKKWESRIRIDGKKKYLGLFDCELKASKAYKKALVNEI